MDLLRVWSEVHKSDTFSSSHAGLESNVWHAFLSSHAFLTLKKIFDFLMKKKKEKKVQVPQSSLFLGVGNPDSSSNQGKQFLELHGPWWWCHGAQCTVHDQFYSRGRQQAEYMWMISLLLAHVTQLVLEYTVLAYSYIIVTICEKSC